MPRATRFLFRGLRRQLLRKLQHALLSIQKMDLREAILATSHDLTATLFAVGEDSPQALAVGTLLDRIDDLLVLKG